MFIFIILLLLVIILSYVITQHVVIRFDTFFRKGFSIQNDECGVWVFCR